MINKSKTQQKMVQKKNENQRNSITTETIQKDNEIYNLDFEYSSESEFEGTGYEKIELDDLIANKNENENRTYKAHHFQ